MVSSWLIWIAEAFECILHKGEIGHVYNIGTQKERQVKDVAGGKLGLSWYSDVLYGSL